MFPTGPWFLHVSWSVGDWKGLYKRDSAAKMIYNNIVSKWPVFEEGEMMIMMVMVMVMMAPFFFGGMSAAELLHQ